MPLTTDPQDPRLSHGVDETPTGQSEAYLVLSAEERAKGFIRPVRRSYTHVGPEGPQYPLRPLTEAEVALWGNYFVSFEAYPNDAKAAGRFWTQAELDAVGNGCGTVTTMAREIAETYARNPKYYGATFCSGCRMHRPVGEFRWTDDGTVVGS